MAKRNAVTKQGKYGTLYLYEIVYTDLDDPCCPDFTTRMWGYDAEHVQERFYNTDDPDWRIKSLKRVPEAGIMADKAELLRGAVR